MHAACLGSGPSLTLADVEACRGLFVIAINDTVQWAPWANVLLGGDLKWWRWHQGCRSFAGLKYTAHRAVLSEFPDVQVLQKTGIEGAEFDVGKIRTGWNSGYVAIQVAAQFGATSILLLGYDMQPSATGQHHWHGAHPDGSHPQYRRCLAVFDTLADPLRERGIDVVNCSRSTALRTFPCRPLSSVLPSPSLNFTNGN